jgi:choline dehydrogenase
VSPEDPSILIGRPGAYARGYAALTTLAPKYNYWIASPQEKAAIGLTGFQVGRSMRHAHSKNSNIEDDPKAAIACVELCREIGNSATLRPFTRRDVMPGNLKGAELKNVVRDAAITCWHETSTARMGRDSMSVVDGSLKGYGIASLRIADGSIMPNATTGNTMAPCVIIGSARARSSGLNMGCKDVIG